MLAKLAHSHSVAMARKPAQRHGGRRDARRRNILSAPGWRPEADSKPLYPLTARR